MRKFDGGAVRDGEAGKVDFDGCFSPEVLLAFARYMQRHSVLSDGSLRSAGNWKTGMPKDVYMRSAFRHFFSWWYAHNGGKEEILEAMCGLMFNLQGYMHELLREVQDDCGIM